MSSTGGKIGIRPTTGVYATYKRLSYQPWTAIAEFIDNTTQSYFDHKEELKKLINFDQLKITIVYETNNGEDVLTITDNAFGMEIKDFERAFQLDKPPSNTNGRNEFGMGLKTAACWFGSQWSVFSTQLGSCNGYHATMNVNQLADSKEESIDLDIFPSAPEEHYTIIRIEHLHKKIVGRTHGKVREFLSNIYRQDIRSGNVSIIYRDTELNYTDPTILEEMLENNERRVWRKEIKFTVPHDGKDLHCHGFVAVRIPASLQDAGFTLMRRGRVIIGGPEKNYRPKELFGEPNSYEYQRLFGEIHMDNWPVTQAKDDFDWHNSGLEENFIETLKPFIYDYRQKANLYRAREKTESKKVIDQVITDFQQAGIISNASAIAIAEVDHLSNGQEEYDNSCISRDLKDSEDEETNNSNNTAVIITGPENYNVTFQYADKDYRFNVLFETSNALAQWIYVAQKSELHYQITINMKHAFFKPFTEKKEFMVVMTKLVIALVLAEIDAKIVSKNGLIPPDEIRRKMNSILEQIAVGGTVL